ncbi:MAG: hypothetical protein R2880_16305 [Deinococcales bacterium]
MDLWSEAEALEYLAKIIGQTKVSQQEKRLKSLSSRGYLPLAIAGIYLYQANRHQPSRLSRAFRTERDKLWKKRLNIKTIKPRDICNHVAYHLEQEVQEDEGAVTLIEQCSLLAPEDIPLSLFESS